MKENNYTRIIEINGQKFQISSHFSDETDNDIINLIYDKFKTNSNTRRLLLMENPLIDSSMEIDK